ncbi:MAG: site-specific DNA-methyltransferase [Meiothermus sp.]|uniref:site-specific DNA-methyltransferase n=1 Tax=Meiothermus sp. TaxID=1955249 RepID=UPI0028CE2B72|nr:site-specific DNA-methyltransferase [Meiothermus sp.]MDT7920758.1 site-specific DNA-methyltransferase [Meiothermus sp.]
MPRKSNKHKTDLNSVHDFRHTEARRKNNPPAGFAPTFEDRKRQTTRYAYDPHLDPQLQWAGKAEHTSFEVDVVSLHIHERISTRAILEAVKRPKLQPALFGETPLSADQQIEFYKHEVGWANRLILGDSLLVMNSLRVKEGMAGKVQMIYIDPPYGIKYASNFQPRIDRRDVKDKDEDLTREPEQIKAYRDTWTLGIHSYLTYLRDRLLLARELLTESGSIFVQINDENLHLVRCLLDEVFGRENFVSVISFVKTSGKGGALLDAVNDFLLWYAKDKTQVKYRQLFLEKELGEEGAKGYQHVQLPDGVRRRLTSSEFESPTGLPEGVRVFKADNLTSQEAGTTTFSYPFEGRVFHCGQNRHWTTEYDGLERLRYAERLFATGNTLSYVRFLDEVPTRPLTNIWTDTSIAGYGDPKVYAVQTNTKVVERCILMTTDPGDLVFDPTCGSGTTAWCAEKWGRRWITCDTSRVALAIARQRLMTAKFDYYELREPGRGPAGGFNYETVPHVTLESIAKNTEIDAIAARYQPQIEQVLAELNAALKGKPIRIRIAEGGRAGQVVDFSAPDTETVPLPSGQVVKVNELLEWEVPQEVPHPAWPKEARQAYWCLLELKWSGKLDTEKEAEPLLETVYRLTGHRWENLGKVPDPMPPEDWPDVAKDALRRFWELKRKKRQEIDESIQRNALQEVLYDRPKIVRGLVRVSGPFTVEAIPVPVVEDPTQEPIPQFEAEGAQIRVNDRGGDYLTTMIALLKQQGGVLFPGGKKLELTNIRPLNLGYLHAEAEAKQDGGERRVAISFGPQHGPVIAHQVQEAIPTAKMNGYQVLIFAGFALDPEAQAFIHKAPVAGLHVHFANIAPDVLVGDLLKTTRASQIFTVFGQPDVRVEERKDGTYQVELRGVDIYDPLTGEVQSMQGKDVAAWFLDTDYDGKTFHICQAFFPGDPDAWEKLQRALKAQIAPEVFEQMRSTVSFPFEPGEHQRIAVKVIDFRGNEVVRVVNLQTGGAPYAHS